MLRFTLTISILVMTICYSFSQNAKLQGALGKALEEMAKAKTVEDWKNLANSFERIAAAEPKEWLPAYYHSFSYLIISFNLKDSEEREQMLDIAQSSLDKAIAIAPEESENWALQGYLYQGRIQVAPMSRGAVYSPKSVEALEKAKVFNPENPRAHLLLGQNLYHMPAFFGGGKKAAMPHLEIAKEKFETFIPETSVHPNWGKPSLERLLNRK